MASHTHSPYTPSALRCLGIVELSEKIMEELGGRPGYRRGLGSLSNLSRTCKFFYEVGMPLLWSEMNSPLPLLRLLPSNSWVEYYEEIHGKRNKWVNTFRLTRYAPQDLDCARLKYYSRHVRTLTCCQVGLASISADRLRTLFSGDNTFLPNLVTLILSDYRHEYWKKLTFLLSPGLKNLEVTAAQWDALDILDKARKVCPSLTSLLLANCIPNSIRDEARELAIQLQPQSFRQLRSLAFCGTLNAQALWAFGKLPHLERLSGISIRKTEIETLSQLLKSETQEEPWFPELRSMYWRVELCPGVHTILESIESSMVFHLATSVCGISTTDGVRTLFEGIASLNRAHALTNVEVYFGISQWNNDYAPPCRLDQALEPLVTSPGITTLSITDMGSAVDITDKALNMVATAFPSLESLCLSQGYWPPEGSVRPTFRSLVTLARSCTKLRHLKMNLDVSQLPTASEVAKIWPAKANTPTWEDVTTIAEKVAFEAAHKSLSFPATPSNLNSLTLCRFMDSFALAIFGQCPITNTKYKFIGPDMSAFRVYISDNNLNREWSMDRVPV